MPPLAIEVMDNHRAALLRSEDAALREMARRWLEVEAALQANVDALALEIAAREDGLLTGSQLSRIRRYRALREQLQAEMAKYVAWLEPNIANRQREAGILAIEASGMAINAQAAEAGINLRFDRLPVESVERFVGLAGNGSPLRPILEDASRVGADALARELIQGLALGRNPREIARRAMRQGIGSSFTRLSTIARTEVVRVSRETTLANYRASSVVKGYRRVAAKSIRTCIACLALDGTEYPLDTPFEEHPNGRCVAVPIIRGQAPLAYEDGRSWFEGQPEATQIQMMGAERHALWQSGQVGWEDIFTIIENPIWGNSPQPTPVRELRQRAGITPE